MTNTARPRPPRYGTVIGLALSLALGYLCLHPRYALADGSGSGTAAALVAPDAGVDNGIATSPNAAQPAPASGIATSPNDTSWTSSPSGFWTHLASDWHDGKLLDATLALLLGIALVLRRVTWFGIGDWLAKGKNASILAAVTTALTTGLATLVGKGVTVDWLGGAVMAGLLLFTNSGAKATAATGDTDVGKASP